MLTYQLTRQGYPEFSCRSTGTGFLELSNVTWQICINHSMIISRTIQWYIRVIFIQQIHAKAKTLCILSFTNALTLSLALCIQYPVILDNILLIIKLIYNQIEIRVGWRVVGVLIADINKIRRVCPCYSSGGSSGLFGRGCFTTLELRSSASPGKLFMTSPPTVTIRRKV